MSKPLKEDYIIRIKSRIEQRLDEPAAEEEKEEFVELMTRGSLVLKGGSYYVTYRETETTGYEGCTTTLKIAADGSRVAMLQGVCDHLGSLAPSACTGHGEVGGDIAVLHVGGDLYDKGGQLCLGQGAVCHGSLGGCGQQSACLIQRSLPGVVVLVGLFKISHGSDSFHSLRELHQFTWVTVTSSRLRLTSSALSASSR